MPVISDRVVLRAWRYRNQLDRIHYVVARADGSKRHLWVDKTNVLYEILDSHLLAMGYTGPASGKIDPEEAQEDPAAAEPSGA